MDAGLYYSHLLKKKVPLSREGEEAMRRNEEKSMEEGAEMLRRKYAK